MYLTREHAQVRDMTRQFAENAIRPLAEELDRESRFPSEIYDRMAELGLFGISVPEAMGGPGFDTVAYAIVMEELSRGYASVADQCGLVELICTLLVSHGDDAQRARWLGDVLAARKRVAYCITEPEAGTDVSGIRTTAARDGDGWVLNGGKIWIHNAPVADVGFVLARTDPEAGRRGMSIFIVDLNADGVTRGPKEIKMGQRASQVGPLSFDDVKLPPEALLGVEGRGFHMMMGVLDKGRADDVGQNDPGQHGMADRVAHQRPSLEHQKARERPGGGGDRRRDRQRLTHELELDGFGEPGHDAPSALSTPTRARRRAAIRPCLGANRKAARKSIVCRQTMTPPVAPSRKYET